MPEDLLPLSLKPLLKSVRARQHKPRDDKYHKEQQRAGESNERTEKNHSRNHIPIDADGGHQGKHAPEQKP
jgi:hypothetical protein